MEKIDFRPFKNEADCVQIGEDFTIENRLDRVSIYGSIDITFDKEGLKCARTLKEILDLTLSYLENEDLPEKIQVTPAETVANPFA